MPVPLTSATTASAKAAGGRSPGAVLTRSRVDAHAGSDRLGPGGRLADRLLARVGADDRDRADRGLGVLGGAAAMPGEAVGPEQGALGDGAGGRGIGRRQGDRHRRGAVEAARRGACGPAEGLAVVRRAPGRSGAEAGQDQDRRGDCTAGGDSHDLVRLAADAETDQRTAQAGAQGPRQVGGAAAAGQARTVGSSDHADHEGVGLDVGRGLVADPKSGHDGDVMAAVAWVRCLPWPTPDASPLHLSTECPARRARREDGRLRRLVDADRVPRRRRRPRARGRPGAGRDLRRQPPRQGVGARARSS